MAGTAMATSTKFMGACSILIVFLLSSACSPAAGARSLLQVSATSAASDYFGPNYTTLLTIGMKYEFFSELMGVVMTTGATVFAPNNDAFIKLGGYLTCLEQNAIIVQNILRYHVVVGWYPAELLPAQSSLPTALLGSNVTISKHLVTGQLMVDEAIITIPGLLSRPNVTVYGIDTVLIPPTYEDLSLLACGVSASASAPAPASGLLGL